jgi:hypothetical protein
VIHRIESSVTAVHGLKEWQQVDAPKEAPEITPQQLIEFPKSAA